MGPTFTSPARGERTTAMLGVAVGVLFGVCLLTGLLSHLIQQPPGWFAWPSRPVWLYRWSQGLHVFCGIAAIPALLAKLWSAYPNLYRWPPVRGVAHAIERAWIVPLLGGALLLLVTGLMNIGYWYGWGFDFIKTHYWTAWIVTGALVVHLSAKLPVLRRALARNQAAAAKAPPAASSGAGSWPPPGSRPGRCCWSLPGRRSPPCGAWRSCRPDARAPAPRGCRSTRTPGRPGSPAGWTTRVGGWPSAAGSSAPPACPWRSSRRAWPGPWATAPSCRSPASRVGARRPTGAGCACATCWTRPAPRADAAVRVQSLQRGGYSSALLNPAHARDPDTLLALELNGAPLQPDHGFPVRLITPSNPGVMQTKWLESVTVL